MKRTLFIITFAFALIFALSLVSFATDAENTYYVVQSEESELASSLLAEGKSIVGIDKLYASNEVATAENSTYFISQFDGKTLNLILAEDVSHSAGNDSGPRATGIRLDKAVTLNVYFNGHSWWITDDLTYSGFFVNNQGAHLSLIGDRTLEEVSANLDVSKINANSKSSKVDYYGGYIGIYIEVGDVTVKNAVLAGHDELIYQRTSNASGKTVLTLDTCMVKISSNYDPIAIKGQEVSKGVAQSEITVRFNHLYTGNVQVNNIVPGSYINNCSINRFLTGSWYGDSRIGSDYIYINDTRMTEYRSIGDTQHPIAKNSTFGKINLTGDSTGGAYATLINSTYTELYLIRNTTTTTRNGILYIVTEADCVTPATRTIYTYDDETKSNVSSVDEEYPLENPALGHTASGIPLDISYTSYTEKGVAVLACGVCAQEFNGDASPLFDCLGYSVLESDLGSLTIGYTINNEALNLYKEATNKSLNYGIYAVAKSTIGDKPIFNDDGTKTAGVVSADLTKYGARIFELKVVGIKEERRDAKLALGAYVEVKDGEKTEYSYLQYGEAAENERYCFTSYNEILDVLPPEIIPYNDIEILVGEAVTLPSSVFSNGLDRELTYTFEGESISIEDYTLTGLKHGTTTVKVSGKRVTGEFTVTVRDYSTYDYVVVIGVDGAGAFFKDAETPNIDKIFENGALTYKCLTSNPTISAQCWGSLMHGVAPSSHGLTNDIAGSTPYPLDSKYPSFFKVIRDNDENAVLASFCNWNSINIGIVENDIGVNKVGGIGDAALTGEILAYLDNNNPDAMFVQFDEADGAGHSSGYGGEAQLAKIAEIDSYIGQIYGAYEEKGILDKTLFIVTADHGGSGTNHGGLTDAEKYVMFAATGKTVEEGTISDMEIRDTAAIVIHALGYEAPAKWTARVPSNLFNGVEAPLHRPGAAPGRYHESEPTPMAGGAGYITNFINKELTTYLTFDGNVSDSCGKNTTANGTLSYEDGYYGQGVKVNQGYVTLNDVDPSMESFTISLWMKASTIASNADPCIISNKDWGSGKYTGFALTFINNGGTMCVRLNYGEGGTKRADCDFALPSDYAEGWVHIVAIFDRDNHKLGLSLDFADIKTTNIPEDLKNTSLDANLNTNVGQDGKGTYGQKVPAVLDELMIFKGAFTNEDLKALASYYGIETE